MVNNEKQIQNEFVRPQNPKQKKKRIRKDSDISTGTVESDMSSVSKTSNLKKRKRKNAYNPEEESRLEKLVFGNPSDVIENLNSANESKIDNETDDEGSIITEISVTDDDNSIVCQSDTGSIFSTSSKPPVKAAAWKDDDDEILLEDALNQQHRKLPSGRPEKTYKELLLNKFTHTLGTPKWAKLDKEKGDGSDDSDDEILKHSNHLKPKTIKSLPQDNIDIKVLTHLNNQTHEEGPYINSIQFHESSMIGLVAGSSGIVSLFEVNGKENNKLHTIQYERFPIHTSRFLNEGTELLSGSLSHAFCHSFDLYSEKKLKIPLPHGITNMKNFEVSPDGKIIAICGRLGEVHLLSSDTKELIGSMQMNKKCRCIAFSADSSKLLSHGESSEIFIWDLKSRTCINRAYDDGCLSASALAVSSDGRYTATGSKQGAVNIYHTKSILDERNPVPIKSILNLTTAITKLKFNPNAEILAMASSIKATAFKMLHLPSMRVFKNFPTFNTQMSNVLDIDFSPASGYMGVGNNRGFALLYRVKHYGNY